MDKNYIIESSLNIDDLDKDISNWSRMSYTSRHKSNQLCYQKYYMTNHNLHRKLCERAKLEHKRLKGIIEAETPKVQDDIFTKHDISFNLQQTEGLVIIDPVIDYNALDLEMLENKFNQYLQLPDYLRQMSDNHSMDLWGISVIDMYNKLKDDYESYQVDNILNMSFDDIEFMEYVMDITKEIHDPIRFKMRELEIDTIPKKTDRINVESILESHKPDTTFNTDISEITPWFTPDEMKDKFDIEVNPFEYLTRESTKIRTDILNANMKRFHNEDIGVKSLIEIGWNPSVPFNEETIKYARERQIKWLNETRNIEIVDLSDFIFESITPEEMADEKDLDLIDLEPVYIVLLSHEGINSKAIRCVTKSSYSHAGLSFDEKMNRVYSFNANNVISKEGGFSIEGIDFWKSAKGVKLKILVFFVSKSIKDKMKENLQWFIKNQNKTKYDYADIFRIALNKFKDTSYSLSMICSQFTDNMLKLVNIDLTGKPSNLVVPGDFDRVKNPKLFCIFNDVMEKFKHSNIKKAIISIRKKHDPNNIIMVPLKESIENIFEGKFEYLSYRVTDNKSNNIINELRIMITPIPLIEAKRIPIGFDKTSNLYIDLPKDLEREYQESHRLLTSYSEDNVQGIKHQLARLFYINSIIEKKIKKMKKGDNSYKELIDLRARVINDFKKYFKIVQSIEPNFDFETYIKDSEYYDKTVIVDKHTLKYTGKTIKEIIKLMM